VVALAPPATARSTLSDLIRRGAFSPVFQPIVDLATGAVVGYEALTRFDDGASPEAHFRTAHALGLGTELEVGCATRAVDEWHHRSTTAWLSVNLTPTAVLRGHVAHLVARSDHRLVVEVPEHAPLQDYAPLRQALADAGAPPLAIENLGTGYTNASNLAKLQAGFVKMGMSTVRGIDGDASHRAKARAMCTLASASGVTLVAKGVETDAEARTLRELGAELGPGRMLGQGFLFGRPAALAA
jgi:EAL domain-containing protein (putative c-di-GMP-specific phosphodiesterase class I)